MGKKVPHTVKFIGLSEHEEKVLSAIFMLSKTRPTAFGLFEDDKNSKPEMMIVNFDDSKAVHEWQTLCIQDTDYSSIPVIRVIRARARDTENYYTRRPFIATRMLSLFERVAAKEFASYDDGAFKDDDLLESSSPGQGADESGQADDKYLSSVLVVDDSLPVRMQMNMALKSYVNKIDMAETGEKALEFIKDNSYDLIFLDVILPGVDGYEICKTIKNDENSKATPVIMLTGNSSAADQVKGTLAGCDSYLIKPVKSDLFKETMARYIQ
ncbi:MAG: two-component system cell cycle response regulator [Gammaproteobacteria bacterium]|jgi:two-component system cell cycle response regulator